MYRIIIFILISTFLTSCNSRIEQNTLDKFVRKNKAESIYKLIYKRNKVNKQKFTEIVELYSNQINQKKLITKNYKDESLRSLFTKRKREGYEYYDSEGNLYYSITYKTTAIDIDSTLNFNYIDFRATDRDLPCIKIPSFAPLRCIYTPQGNVNKLPSQSYFDSLELVNPIILEGKEYYHYDLLQKNKSEIPVEKRRNTIVLNIKNNYVRSHIDLITKDLESILELDSFDLAYMEDISTPKLRIAFDSGFNPTIAMKLTDYFRQKLKNEILLTPLYTERFVPMKGDIIIGHAFEQPKRIGF